MCIISSLLIYLVGPIIIALMDQTANEGDAASFICQTDGEPLPTISWYFNGAPLNESNTAKYYITEIPNSNTVILAIINVELSDMGTYTCNATNIISSDTSSGRLMLNGELFML